jgi:hypothetical protein
MTVTNTLLCCFAIHQLNIVHRCFQFDSQKDPIQLQSLEKIIKIKIRMTVRNI